MKLMLKRLSLAAAVAGLLAGSLASPAFAYHHRTHHHGWRDTVGSIHARAHSYGRNRFTGQRYHKCTMDLGYGRTEPCDGGHR
jgi:hypothetical protein